MTTKATPRPVSTKPYQANIVHRGHTAYVNLGYPDAANRYDGLRFGYTAEISVRAAEPLLGDDKPDVRITQGSIQGTRPDDAMTRAQVYTLACEIGAVLLRLLEEGQPMSEALAQLAESPRFDNVDWKLKL